MRRVYRTVRCDSKIDTLQPRVKGERAKFEEKFFLCSPLAEGFGIVVQMRGAKKGRTFLMRPSPEKN